MVVYSCDVKVGVKVEEQGVNLLTIQVVSKQLGVCPKTVRKLIPGVRIGRCLRYKQDDVNNYVNSHSEGGNSYGRLQEKRHRKVRVQVPQGIVPLETLLRSSLRDPDGGTGGL